MKPSSKQLNLYYRLPVICYCAAIFWQSSQSMAFVPPLFPNGDKVIHFIMYALLVILVFRNLYRERPGWALKTTLIAAIAFSMAYGLSDEIHQAFVPSRCASFFDFLADAAGSISGGAAMARLKPVRFLL